MDKLTEQQKQVLLKVFIENIDGLMQLVAQGAPLLVLTEPLCDLETRKTIFKDIVATYEKEGEIVFKPHPNDLLDYTKVFPGSLVIDRKVPMEMMNFIPGLMFEKVVAVFTELSGITFAKECVRLGSDFMDKYEDPAIHRYNDNL